MPVLPAAYRFQQRQRLQPKFHVKALQLAVSAKTSAAQRLQTAVKARLYGCTMQQDLTFLHRHSNAILPEKTCKHFPAAPMG